MIATLLCRLLGHRRATARELRMIASKTVIKLEMCPRCLTEHEPDYPTGTLVRVVSEGFMIPRGFGVAWIRWQPGDAVCMPIPLNIASAAARRAWFWCCYPALLVKDPRQAFLEGYAHGLQVGRKRDGGRA